MATKEEKRRLLGRMSGKRGTPTGEDMARTARRMGVGIDQSTISGIERQARYDNLYLRGVSAGQSTWERGVRAAKTEQLKSILDAGTTSNGKPLSERTRGLLETELSRRGAAPETSQGPSVTMDIGGKTVTFDPRNDGYRRHKTAIDEINSGRVSFDPNATRGLSASVRAEYGKAREKAISDALSAIDKDTTFKKAENWDQMSTADKLSAYGTHLAQTTGNTQVQTYGQLKSDWLRQRQIDEASRRRAVEDAANPKASAGGAVPGGAPSAPGAAGDRSIVSVDDLQYGNTGGFSGPNGMPFLAGSSNQRLVSEFGKAKAREASEQAMYRQQQAEQRRQAEKDSAAFASYYAANYQAIEQQRKLQRAQQQLEIERRKQARRYTEMATHAVRMADAGGV